MITIGKIFFRGNRYRSYMNIIYDQKAAFYLFIFFLSFSRLTEERIDDYSYHFKHFLNLFEEISTRAKSQDVIVAV